MTVHRAACQCGGLTVTAEGDPEFVILCNCRACQKRTGSAFGVGAYFRKDQLVLAGEPSRWRRTAESGRGLEQCFCPVCGTHVWWTLEMRPDHVGVALGAFDTALPEPVRAIWAGEKHDWVRFPDHWPVFEKAVPT